MPVPSTVADLSTTASSNYPAGSESPSTVDDYIRAHAAIIRQVSDAKLSAGLATSSGLTVSATDKILGRSSSGSGAVEEIACTSAGRALLDDADASAQRTTLGLGTASTATLGTSSGQVPTADQIPSLVPSTYVPVRQTVLSGPVDSSGYAAFGGSTASTSVTASGTLKATAAAGGDANYTGSITNPSWTGLSTNGTMYLYLDITSGGVVTTGSTTLAPVYQWGGTYSTTSGQNTFNIQEMTMKVGNGSSASQVYRVFVGEVTVAGGVVTAIVWYALMGRYDSGFFSVAASTTYSKNHNIGFSVAYIDLTLAQNSDGSGWHTKMATSNLGDNVNMAQTSIVTFDRKALSIYTTGKLARFYNSGGEVLPTSGYARVICDRGW